MDRFLSDDKKVTVMIPIYNGEKYIEETVRSVLGQTYPNIEILCVIDGTKDRSRDILLGIGDPRIVVYDKENRGAIYRRNEGLQLASGQYVWFLDHDDVLMPDCIEAAMQTLIEGDYAAVAVNGYLIDSQGRKIRRLYRVNKPTLSLHRLAKGNELYSTSQVLIRKDALLKVNGFNEGAGSAVDWDLWIRLAQVGERMGFLDRYLMGYRLHESNDSRDFEKTMRGELHILEKTLEQTGNRSTNMSYSYMRYSSRAADWRALGKALKLNTALLVNPRFYIAVYRIAVARRMNKKNGGIA